MKNAPLSIRERFELFIYRADMLQQTRLVKNGFKLSFTEEFTIGRNPESNIQEPDEDDLRSFLITFRPFILKKDPVFLNRIFTLSRKRIADESLKNKIIDINTLWLEEKNNSFMKFVYDGKNISLEEVTDCWINGIYFHNDIEKISMLKNMPYHARSILRVMFLEYLIQAAKYIFETGSILKKVMKENLLIEKIE